MKKTFEKLCNLYIKLFMKTEITVRKIYSKDIRKMERIVVSICNKSNKKRKITNLFAKDVNGNFKKPKGFNADARFIFKPVELEQNQKTYFHFEKSINPDLLLDKNMVLLVDIEGVKHTERWW